jgi:DNA-binding XRE family transcriptional regulator
VSPTPRKRRGDRFVSREGDFVIVSPGEEPRRPRARDRAGPALELGKVRHARNITQTELANELGVDQAQISRLERRGDPRLSTVLDYLAGLGAAGVELAVRFEDGSEVTLPLAGQNPTP